MRGEVRCPRCHREVAAGRNFCQACALLVVNKSCSPQRSTDSDPVELCVSDYALSTDLAISRAVSRIPILPKATELLIAYWHKPMKRAELLGDGVRVSARQFPSIYRIVSTCADVLGVRCPELFIKQDPTFNAYTLGTNQDNVVVVHSSLVDIFQRDELAFIIGHELGHIRSQHVTYTTLGSFLAGGLIAFAQPLVMPLVTALNAWSREAEITADRAGYLVSHSPDAAIRALVLLAVGSRKLLPEIDLSTYLSQSTDLQGLYGKANLWFGGNNHPYLVDRTNALLEFVFSERGQAAAMKIVRNRTTPDWIAGGPTATPQNAMSQIPAPKSAQREFCGECGFEQADALDTACPICGTKTK